MRVCCFSVIVKESLTMTDAENQVNILVDNMSYRTRRHSWRAWWWPGGDRLLPTALHTDNGSSEPLFQLITITIQMILTLFRVCFKLNSLHSECVPAAIKSILYVFNITSHSQEQIRVDRWPSATYRKNFSKLLLGAEQRTKGGRYSTP